MTQKSQAGTAAFIILALTTAFIGGLYIVSKFFQGRNNDVLPASTQE